MAKGPMAVSKETSPGASAVSNIPFMAASSHDGLSSGMYQKPEHIQTGDFSRFSSIK